MVGIALANEKAAATVPRVFSGSVRAGSGCPFRVGSCASRSRQLQGPNIAHFRFIDRTARHKGSRAVVICEVLVGREFRQYGAGNPRSIATFFHLAGRKIFGDLV